ncbi:MAG: hypothetical protein MJA83_11370 [Gammaproteobacteria bacterium]|nr:hypothetical protein [Gammaproteobacteria bacterium]
MATCIVDGHYILHRCMHVPQLRMLSTKDGKPTGGTFGVLKSIRSTVGEMREINRVIVVFDGGHSERRKKLYPKYKVRESKDDVDPDGLTYSKKFSMQINYLTYLLPRMGVKVVRLRKREGDDVVSLLAREIVDPLKIVSSDDKDMFQLVSKDVHVWRPLASQRLSLSNFEEEIGYPPHWYLLRRSVLGDSSDKISGVPGVGEKTVDTVLDDCDDIGQYPFDGFFETAMSFSGKRYQAIFENIDVVLRNYELMDMTREEFTEEEKSKALQIATGRTSLELTKVKDMFVSLEFYSMIDDFYQWITRFQLLR